MAFKPNKAFSAERKKPRPLKSAVSRRPMMILVIFEIVGVAVIISGLVAFIWNVRQAKKQRNTKFLILIILAVGVVLAAGCFFVEYPYGENKRIVGFPFPAGGFVKQNDRWLISMGPMTLPFGFANALFGFVLPHLIFCGLRRKNAG